MAINSFYYRLLGVEDVAKKTDYYIVSLSYVKYIKYINLYIYNTLFIN